CKSLKCSWLGCLRSGRGLMFRVRAGPGGAGQWLGLLPARTLTQAQLAFDDDAVARVQAGCDRRTIALGAGQLDVAHLDALIGHGNEDVWALLAALDRHRWHGDGLRPGGKIDFDIDVLSRPKLELLVGECSFGGDCAGRTADAAVNEIERTAGN